MPWHTEPNICRSTTCTKPVKAKKLCSMHYERWRKYGNIKIKKRGPRLSSGIAVFRAIVSDYKKGAYIRKLQYSLPDGYAEALLRGNCYYCGASPGKERTIHDCYGGIKYNGIDRIDNSEGYILGNVVSSCYKCNVMKHTSSKDDFIKHIRNIFSIWGYLK